MDPAALQALAHKYRQLLTLAQDRAGWETLGLQAVPTDARHGRRLAMRQVAQAFPGALAELQRSTPDMLQGRLHAVEACLAAPHAPVPQWLAVIHAFHTTLRELLAQHASAPKAQALERTAQRLGLDVRTVRAAIPWYKPG